VVVAGEVRSLAQRSAAAKEIKALIDTSVERVQSGNSLVDEAGRTMNEIIGAVQRVNDIMGEIAAASEEQGSGICCCPLILLARSVCPLTLLMRVRSPKGGMEWRQARGRASGRRRWQRCFDRLVRDR
jgi:hypothetical protein